MKNMVQRSSIKQGCAGGQVPAICMRIAGTFFLSFLKFKKDEMQSNKETSIPHFNKTSSSYDKVFHIL